MNRSSPATTALIAVLYVALTIVLTYPLSFHPSTTEFRPSADTNLFIWTYAWDAHAFIHQPLSIFDANIFYPFRHTLAYSENLIGGAILVAPVEWFLHDPILAMNLAALVTAPLCAFGAYLLARRLGLSAAASAICGVIFGFVPPRFLRMEQAHLTAVQWIPFSLAYAHTYLTTRRARDLRLAILFFTAEVLASGHGAVFLSAALLGLALYRFALGGRIPLRRLAADVGLPGVLLFVPSILVMVPYRFAQVEVGLRRDLGDWDGAWASLLLSPSRVDAFVLDHLGHIGKTITENGQAYLFAGWLPLLLALAAFLAPNPSRHDSRHLKFFYLLVFAGCVFLAFPPPHGPWRFIYWMPGLNFIRVPTRFMILGMLGIAVVGAYGVERLIARLSERRRAAAAAIVGCAIIFEFWTPLDFVPARLDIPPIDRWLDTQPKPFAIAEVPLADSRIAATHSTAQSVLMLHSMAHWQKTIYGFSGTEPEASANLWWTLTRFPDEDSIRAISDIGVKYLVVHTDQYGAGEWAEVEVKMGSFADRLHLEHEEPGGRVYSVH